MGQSRADIESLCQQTWKRVYGLAYRALFDKSLAEDVTQEVFLRALPHLEAGIEDVDKSEAYLMQCARNLLRDRWRQEKRQMGWLERLLEETPPSTDPEQQHLLNDEIQRVRTGIGELSSDQQKVLQWRLVEGLETSEVARRMSRSVEAVRQIQCRALRELRSGLSEKETGSDNG